MNAMNTGFALLIDARASLLAEARDFSSRESDTTAASQALGDSPPFISGRVRDSGSLRRRL